MKTYSKILTASLGLILFASEVSQARSGDMPLSNDRALGAMNHYSDSADPMSDWLERNAERLNLYIDEPVSHTPEAPKPQASTPYGPHVNMGPPPVRIEAPPDALEEFFLKSVREGIKDENEKRTSEPEDIIDNGASGKRVAAKMSELLKTVLETQNVCEEFISEDGLGEMGNVVYKEVLAPENKETLDGPRDVRSERLCPNYGALSPPARAYFWVYVKAASAFLEGSCDPRSGTGKKVVENGKVRTFKRVKGPNGYAVGYWALHEGQEDQYGGEKCEKGDAKSAKRSAICTVSMLTNQIKNKFDLFTRDGYWGVFRPQGDVVRKKNGTKVRVQISRGIVAAIRALPFCGYKGRQNVETRKTLSAAKVESSVSPPAKIGKKTYAPAVKTRRARDTYR